MADLKESIALCCKQLKISANFAERAMSQEGETNQEYLYNLLSNEVTYRTERRKTKLTTREKTSSSMAAREPGKQCCQHW